MATLRIECIDSATGNLAGANLITAGGIIIPTDGLSRAEITEYASLSNKVNGPPVGAIPFFTFQNTDLSILDNEQINSITLYVRQGIIIRNGQLNFASLGARMGPSQTTGATSLRASHMDFNSSYNIAKDEWFTITIPNLATLKRVVDYGLCIGYPNGTLTEPSSGFYSSRSDSPPYIVIEYIDSSVPPTVTAISPILTVIDRTSPVAFTWHYAHSANRPQSHYDLQYYNNAWVTLRNKIASSAHSYTAPANTLPETIPNGETQWRVRAWINNGTISSAWSDPAPFIVRSSPSTPNITTITPGARPTFTWQATQQSGYEIEVLDADGNVIYASGEQFGIDRTWRYPEYLPDGSYTFRVRVVNTFSLWSPWAQAGFGVVNVPPGPITAQATDTCRHTMMITWQTDTAFEAFYILRNSEPIARLDNDARSYEDTAAHGKNTYIVRGVVNPYFSDSNHATDTVRVRNAVIASFGTRDWTKLERLRGGRPIHSIRRDARTSYRSYEGVRLPSVHRGIQRNIVHTISFTFNAPEHYDALLAMENKTVVYKDCMGQRVIGNLSIPSSSLMHMNKHVYDFEISITETNVQEIIAYE